MRRFSIPLTLAGLLVAVPATAQIRQDVTVNPNATGTKVLLYPGGKYGRVQRELLQPGEPDPNAPIVLHMPRKHVARRVAAKPKAKAVAVAAPPPQQQTVPLSEIPKESAARLVMDEAAKPAPPAPAKSVAKQAPPPKKPPPPTETDSATGLLSGDQTPAAPARVASIEPGAAQARSSILFAPGAEEPPQSALETVRGLAPGLSTALWSGTAHVQLDAYGGAHGDKGSDARRLSLKRALIIRQLLIDDGIPSERIVVRALGGASSGALDRVDIFVAA